MATIRRALLALAGLLVAVAMVVWLFPGARAPWRSGPLVTVSPATTHITEPLRADGYVDYFAALNQHLSKGVTPDNNSTVPMVRALGPEVIPANIRARYFQMLGVSPPRPEGPWFVSFDEYLKRVRGADPSAAKPDANRDAAWQTLRRATSRPWSREELPEVAAWLEANDRPLALIVEASKRPRRFEPLIADGERAMLFELSDPVLQAQREVVRALAARAVHRLHDGRIEEAWRDALACHRLSRLAGQGWTFIELLVAIGIGASGTISSSRSRPRTGRSRRSERLSR